MNWQKYEELLDLAAKSGYDKDSRIKLKIFNAIMHDNEDYLDSIEKKLIAYAEDNSNPFPKDQEKDFTGPIEIGRSSWGSKVSLSPNDLAHTTIWGATQQGKSVLLGRLTLEIMNNTNASVLIFDPKRSLRSLTTLEDRIYSMRLDKFPFNPFSIFESGSKSWLQEFAGLFAQTGDLMTGSRSFILDTLKSLESRFKNKKSYPTMFDFLEEVKRLQSKSSGNSPTYRYAERVGNRTKALLYTFEDTFNYEVGFPIEKLLNPSSSLILEYDGVDPLYAKTVALLIIQSAFHYQMVNGNRGGEIDLFVIIDEAEEILGRGGNQVDGLGVEAVNKLYERSKELQIGLISAVHHSRINPVIRENARSRFCFNLSSSEDIIQVAKDFGLNEDQEKVIEDLEVGETVVKVKGQREDPFKAKIEPVPLPETSDTKLKKHNKSFLKKIRKEVVPRREQQKKKSKEDKEETSELEMEENNFLTNIAKWPFLSLAERRKKLGWGNNKIKRISDQLRNKGLIRKKKLKTGGRGRPKTLLELTSKAINYLKSNNVKPKQSEGRGGVIHLYWVTRISEFLEKNDYDVRTEVKLGKVITDVLAVDKKGTRLAVEMEVTSAKNTLSKLPKLLNKVEKAIIVVNKKALMKEFEEGLEDQNVNRGSVELRKAQEMDLSE